MNQSQRVIPKNFDAVIVRVNLCGPQTDSVTTYAPLPRPLSSTSPSFAITRLHPLS